MFADGTYQQWKQSILPHQAQQQPQTTTAESLEQLWGYSGCQGHNALYHSCRGKKNLNHYIQYLLKDVKRKRNSKIKRKSVLSIPAIIGPPVTGNWNKLQEELDTRQLVEDLCWFPVQPKWTVLYQKLHHFHHLLTAIADCLENEMRTQMITAETQTLTTKG